MMWEAGRMGLVFVGQSLHEGAVPRIRVKRTSWSVGPDAGESIRSVLQTGSEVYAAAGSRVIKYFRGKEVGEFTSPDASGLGTMILLGDEMLVLKEDGTGLFIWDVKTGGGFEI
jgi:hypothetical protein